MKHPLLYQLVCNFTIAVFLLHSVSLCFLHFLHLAGPSSQLPQASVFYSTLSSPVQLLFWHAACTDPSMILLAPAAGDKLQSKASLHFYISVMDVCVMDVST